MFVAGILAAAAGILTPRAEGVVPRDTAPFPLRPFSHMEALLEKTIFQVDVLTLDIRVDPRTAERLQAMVEGFEYSNEVADAVSGTVMAAPQVWVRMEFLRSVSQKEYLGGIKDNMKKAMKAGLIDEPYFEDVQEKTPRWYDFLKDRKVQKGDVMVYWVHGDTLDSTYHGVEGTVLLDMTGTNPTSRYGVLGSYFAPKSEFRKNLVRSLVDSQ